MQYFVTVSSKDILRITDGEGASLTFRVKKDVAQVLFISVPEDNRRKGRGKALLLASEKLLTLRGIKQIYADFVEGAEAVDWADGDAIGGVGDASGIDVGDGASGIGVSGDGGAGASGIADSDGISDASGRLDDVGASRIADSDGVSDASDRLDDVGASRIADSDGVSDASGRLDDVGASSIMSSNADHDGVSASLSRLDGFDASRNADGDDVNDSLGRLDDVGASHVGFDGVRPMLADAGFVAGDEVYIYALPTAMVVYDPCVKRALETDAHGRYFVSLADLSVSQMSSVMRFLENIKADVSCYDIAHLEDKISGVVCDGAGEPIAMILCSDNGDDLHVNALISKSKGDSGSGLIAILGMISALKTAGAEFAYRRITMAGYNKKLTALIGRTLSSGAELEVIGKCVTMRKDIEDRVCGTGAAPDLSVHASTDCSENGSGTGAATDCCEKVEYKASRDDFMKNAWERELIRFPLQKNVTWKGPWYRG